MIQQHDQTQTGPMQCMLRHC